MAPEFTDDEARSTVTALRAYLFETRQYLRGTGYEPCHPDCPHCAPKVEHFAAITADLQERERRIRSALTKMGADPDA